MPNGVNLNNTKIASVEFRGEQSMPNNLLNGLSWEAIPGSQPLDGITIPGALVIITGDNGAGKTLLLNAFDEKLMHSPPFGARNYIYIKHNYYRTGSIEDISETVTAIARELLSIDNNPSRMIYEQILGKDTSGKVVSLDKTASNKKLAIEQIRSELNKLSINERCEPREVINTSIAICIGLPPIPHKDFYRCASPMSIFAFRCKYYANQCKLINETDLTALMLVFSDIWNQIEDSNKGMKVLELDRLFREELIQSILGPQSPIDEINSYLKENDFPYTLINKIYGERLDVSINLQLFDSKSNREISFDALSSGEKVILTILSWKFMSFENHATHKTSVVLLDEADKHFGPNLIELYQKTLRRVFVEKGVQVIMSTHRPDMVALANDSEIFMLQRKNQVCTIKPCNRLLALSRLTRNLSSFYNLTTSVFTEGFDDANFYNAIYGVLKTMASSIRQMSRSFFEYDLIFVRYKEHRLCKPEPGKLYVTNMGWYRMCGQGNKPIDGYLFHENSRHNDFLSDFEQRLRSWDGSENSMIKNGILKILLANGEAPYLLIQEQLKQLSFRYQMQFRAATDQKGKSGDWSNVARVVIRTSNELVPGTHARQPLASGANTPRFNFKLFKHYQVDGTFGLIDSDNQDRESMFKKMKTAIDPEIARKRIVSLERHSLENFHFDLVSLCSLFDSTAYHPIQSESLKESMNAVKAIFQKLRESVRVPDSEINSALDAMYREAFQQCAAYDPYLVLRRQLRQEILKVRILAKPSCTKENINQASSILLEVLMPIPDEYFLEFYRALEAYENSKTQENEEAISQLKNREEFKDTLDQIEINFKKYKKNPLFQFSLITTIENIMKKEKLLDVKSLPLIDKIKQELHNNITNGIQYGVCVPYHYMNTKNQACAITLPYPKLFKELRGHDFEHMLIDYENRNEFKESILKQIENMGQAEQELSLFIPHDLVKSFLDLNARVKTQWVSKADPMKYASLTPEEAEAKGYYQTPQAPLAP
jgi:energy-coupling factor transporter ATP-binding protein EcfA2